jgi:hypothetical protein
MEVDAPVPCLRGGLKGLWDGLLHLDAVRFQHLSSISATERDQSNDPVAIGLGGVVGLKTIPKTLAGGMACPRSFWNQLEWGFVLDFHGY